MKKFKLTALLLAALLLVSLLAACGQKQTETEPTGDQLARIQQSGTIIVAMEGTTRINRCLEPDGYCSRNGVPNCPVHKFYSRIQTKLDEAFQEMTVAALLADDFEEKLKAI